MGLGRRLGAGRCLKMGPACDALIRVGACRATGMAGGALVPDNVPHREGERGNARLRDVLLKCYY